MLTKVEEKTIALAGIFQNCYAVQNLAQTGRVDQNILNTAVNAIFSTVPDNVSDIFSGTLKLKTGFNIIEKQLDSHNKQSKSTRNNDLTRYSITVLFLASKLLKDQDKLKKMADGIERAKMQSEHFGSDHTNIYASLGGLYSDTISLLNPRIMVSGEPEYLNNPENANRIRTLLLSAIRCAVLWKQLGGNRWQLLFKRKQIVLTAKNLLEQI
jgi:high frequency lysogenization protein